jgi:hypothetical protein
MKTLHKIIGLLLLVLIGYQLTLEGYPNNASFTVPSTGNIPDSVLDQLRVGHSSLMVIRNNSLLTNKLDNLFNSGLTPGLVIYIPAYIEKGSAKDKSVMNQLRTAMKLPDEIQDHLVYVYLPQSGVYTQYYGRCNDMTMKINPEGTNCA